MGRSVKKEDAPVAANPFVVPLGYPRGGTIDVLTQCISVLAFHF